MGDFAKLLGRSKATPWSPKTDGFVTLIWGRQGSGKTAYTLSCPEPIVPFDFELNFLQTVSSIPGIRSRKEIVDPYQYLVHELADRSANQSILNQFLSDYNSVIQTFSNSGQRGTIALDSTTVLWQLITYALVPLRPDGRVKSTWDFGPANHLYQSLFQKARRAGLVVAATARADNLWISSEDPESGKVKSTKTDIDEIRTQGDSLYIADVVIYVSKSIVDGRVQRKYIVLKCNPNEAVYGKEFITPEDLTYDRLVEAIEVL